MIRTIGAPNSNAGLAVVVPELMENKDDLIDYAYRTKEEIVSKTEALEFSKKPGIYLFELSAADRA